MTYTSCEVYVNYIHLSSANENPRIRDQQVQRGIKGQVLWATGEIRGIYQDHTCRTSSLLIAIPHRTISQITIVFIKQKNGPPCVEQHCLIAVPSQTYVLVTAVTFVAAKCKQYHMATLTCSILKNLQGTSLVYRVLVLSGITCMRSNIKF